MRRPRALVTGGAGFIGSHLVDRLLSEGVDVLVVDDLSTGSIENLPEAARLEPRDVASGDLASLSRTWRPEVVYHLAAQASVPISLEHPLRDLEVNVIGAHRVAVAARDSSARRLVFVSSGGAIYGETARPATELDRPAPRSYYGVHKLAAEGHIALAGVSYAVARPSNVYGPRQRAGLEGAVVAAFLQQATTARRLQIHGDGSQSRDFVHVRDVVDALWRLGGDDVPSGIWNVAAGRHITILELARLVDRAVGFHLARDYVDSRPGDVHRSALSAARLRQLGWRPGTSLRVGLAELSGPPSGVPGHSARVSG